MGTQYSPQTLQNIQRLEEDRTIEAITTLAANITALEQLRKYYQGLTAHTDFLLKDRLCADAIAAFPTEMNSLMDELNMQTSRAQFLIQIIAKWKSLVRSVNIVLETSLAF
jgi:hypothetical protein